MADRTLRRVLRRALVALALVGAALPILLAAPASAHAVLVSSSPTDGARLATSPAEVRLRFDENVELVRSGSDVLADSGRSQLRAPPRPGGGGREVILPLRASLPRGAYTASWRVVSADGHVVTGSIRFGVGEDPTAGPRTASPPVAPMVLGVVARALGYAGSVLMVGLPLVGLMLWPATLRQRRARRLQVAGTTILAAGTLLDLLQRGLAAAGSGLGAVWHLAGLGLVVHTHDGRLLLVRLAGCVVLGPAIAILARQPPSWALRAVVLLAWLAVVVSLAWTGHAVAGSLSGLAVVAAGLHVAAMTIWLGGLVLVLSVVLRTNGPDVTRLRGWSRVAMTAVGVLIATGTWQAVRQVHPIPSLGTTGYGLVLLTKVALVAVVIGAAQFARRAVHRRDTGSQGLAAVRRSVRVESLVLVVVLVLTAVLVARPPARETYGPAVNRSLALPDGTLRIAVPDTHRGTQHVTVRALDRQGQVVRLSSVNGRFAAPHAGVGGLAVRFVRGRGEIWHSTNAVLPLPVTWTLTFTVRPGGDLAYVADTTYRVW